MSVVKTIAVVLLAAASCLPSVVRAQPTDLAAADRYRAAAAWLSSLPQRPYIAYVMDQTGSRRGRVLGTLTEDVVERRADRRSWNRVTAGTMFSLRDVKIGRHYLIPDAFLPYRNESAPQGVLPTFDTPDPQGIKTIATVRSAISYDVSLVANESLEGCGDVAHLRLRPLHDPQRYNVREMWVRRTDNRLCKATFASRLYQDDGQGTPYPTIDTASLDERGLITSWHSFVQLHFLIGTFAAVSDGTFSNVAWAQQEPDYLFERSQWDAHVRATQSPASPVSRRSANDVM